MRLVSVLALLLVAGCGGAESGGALACTAIGAVVGVSVEIAPGLTPGMPESVPKAELEVCWDGSCHPFDVRLRPSTRAVDEECEPGGPDASCSARLEETGGVHGLISVEDLPEQPVRVTLVVSGAEGDDLVRETVEATPAPVYPNGPDCPAGGPQLSLHVDERGGVESRPVG